MFKNSCPGLELFRDGDRSISLCLRAYVCCGDSGAHSEDFLPSLICSSQANRAEAVAEPFSEWQIAVPLKCSICEPWSRDLSGRQDPRALPHGDRVTLCSEIGLAIATAVLYIVCRSGKPPCGTVTMYLTTPGLDPGSRSMEGGRGGVSRGWYKTRENPDG